MPIKEKFVKKFVQSESLAIQQALQLKKEAGLDNLHFKKMSLVRESGSTSINRAFIREYAIWLRNSCDNTEVVILVELSKGFNDGKGWHIDMEEVFNYDQDTGRVVGKCLLRKIDGLRMT